MVTTVFLNFVLAYIGLKSWNLHISSSQPPTFLFWEFGWKVSFWRLILTCWYFLKETHLIISLLQGHFCSSVIFFFFFLWGFLLQLLLVVRSSFIITSRAAKMKCHKAQTFATFHLEQCFHLKILRCSHFPRFLNIQKCLLDKTDRGMQKHREFVPEMLETKKDGKPPSPARNWGISKVTNNPQASPRV